MKILTSREMKEIDRRTIEDIGIPGPVLMENAGLQIFQALRARFPHLKKEKVLIVAGKGNNGGDGLVIARHLYNHGCLPRVLLLATDEEVGGDAALNLKIARRIGVPVKEIPSIEAWKSKRRTLWEASIIVDAIFGTGLIKAAGGIYAQAIADINKTKAYKLAVDIPSGLSSDSYELIGPAVKANLTVTLVAPKIAHLFPPAENQVGELIVADISVPRRLFEDKKLKLELVEKSLFLPSFKRREKDTHKGTYGHLFIISGSLGKTGAAIMAAKAALKTGAGLVTVGTPVSCLPIVARSMMEIMTEPLPESEDKTVSASALKKTLNLLRSKDGLLIGPGISTHPSTSAFLLSLVPKLKLPLVVDADGLNILATRPELLKRLPRPAILTPHPGEFARLIALSIPEVLKNKLTLVPKFARKYGVYLILKGYRTLVGAPDGRVFVNPTGNPGMASGGTGDVLSGILASLLVQDKDPLRAALAAVFVHGLSGDIAAAKVGEKALVAGDLIRFLPQALKSLESEAQ